MNNLSTVTLIGLGLMGGSIAKALRARSPETRIHAFARRAETRQACLDQGLADAVFSDAAQAVRGAELVIICTPVKRIPAIVDALKSGLAVHAIVTDVGSTKAWLDDQLAAFNFVGSHPMCGSEQTGLDAATAELYAGAVCVVTSQGAAADVVAGFWEGLGSRVVRMTAAEHDAVAALTSHVPHLTASALVLAVTEGQDPVRLAPLCSSGFRDTTRVASGDAAMWREIVESNPQAIAEGLRETASRLAEFADRISAGDFDALQEALAAAASLRNGVLASCATSNVQL